ncbi:LysR family transcriptional regulator [Aeromicrobium sp. Root472D3]|uniref:LysR family transcriptional regulator n=2 Tax=unclassified Aeromicrobium TaxID=2633570 RepID=UPI0006FDD52C|nr:LysR family transcriptional regulator [Aeromicrobium sp. Root472D3]KQP24800.1 LysR family transcriptional regulator [Aeromicrobium sp. Leaf272]KQX75893.1 LysR family transcriptional regulator [Aeromicrobium sp. Root472D3]
MEAQLSFRRLEVFRLVVEERSVTRAAEVLMIAQPAVSAQLRALESWVGAPLFVRKGNRLVLTETGERTAAWAKEVLAGAAQIRRDVGDLASGETGRVIIASSMAVGTYLIPPVAAQLGHERPNADITVAVARPDEVVHGVETGEFDFGVLNWDGRDIPESMTSELLAVTRLGIFTTAALIAPGTTLSPTDAMALPFVGAPKDVVYQRNLVEQLRAAGLEEPRFTLRLGHSEAMIRAAAANDWAIIAPAYSVGSDARLHEVEVPELKLTERIVLLHRRDRLHSPLQRDAVDAIREALASTE